MEKLYESKIIEIGIMAEEFLKEDTMVIFNDTAPPELRDICFVHEKTELIDRIKVGDWLTIGDERYKIHFVGDVANDTIRDLGHATLKFDGASSSDLPGHICVDVKPAPAIKQGTSIIFSRNK